METSHVSPTMLRLYNGTQSSRDATAAEPSITVLGETLRKVIATHATAGTDPRADPDGSRSLRAFVARLRDVGCPPETVVISVKAILRKCRPRATPLCRTDDRTFRTLHEAVVLSSIEEYFDYQRTRV